MEMVREAWTDERLDDLVRHMDQGFERVERDVRDLKAEMDGRFQQVDSRFDRLDARFDVLQRTMIQVGGGLIGALFVALVGLVTTQL
jgi:hypothetical protein